jgi:hypothetical protein
MIGLWRGSLISAKKATPFHHGGRGDAEKTKTFLAANTREVTRIKKPGIGIKELFSRYTLSSYHCFLRSRFSLVLLSVFDSDSCSFALIRGSSFGFLRASVVKNGLVWLNAEC